MVKYSLGWKDLNRQNQPEERLAWGRALGNFILFALTAYILISGLSILAVTFGEKISYDAFWHAPWRWMLKLFLKGG